MGRIRALSAHRHPHCKVVVVADSDPGRASELAREIGCAWVTDWQQIPAMRDVDALAVCTPHKFLTPVGVACLASGKHLFCEKPMGRSLAEGLQLAEAARTSAQHSAVPAAVVGFTLRHHPAVARARQLVHAGAIGQPFYIRASYGHGGRPGYDREWRTDPDLGGGGELLDQGVHLIDLSRWFLGDFPEVDGTLGAYFWRGECGLAGKAESFAAEPGLIAEDNAFLLLRTAMNQAATLHASWTQWKNCFAFEIFGAEGTLSVNGLGGSYGAETLVHTRRNRDGGVPEVFSESFEGTAEVWDREWSAFVAAALPGSSSASDLSQPASVHDGCEVLRITERIYDLVRQRHVARSALA